MQHTTMNASLFVSVDVFVSELLCVGACACARLSEREGAPFRFIDLDSVRTGSECTVQFGIQGTGKKSIPNKSLWFECFSPNKLQDDRLVIGTVLYA